MKNRTTKALRIISLALLCCTFSMLLCSCAKGNKFSYQGVSFKDKKTHVTYNYAPACYEPIAQDEKIYGHWDNTRFYALEGKDPLSWLCEENGTVFYADGTELPTLGEMQISYIDLCVETNSTITRGKITSDEDISSIIEHYISAKSISYRGLTPEKTYKIRFADTELGIYYSLTYIRYTEDYVVLNDDSTESVYGKDFLYNRFEDKFIVAPEALVGYINELY